MAADRVVGDTEFGRCILEAGVAGGRLERADGIERGQRSAMLRHACVKFIDTKVEYYSFAAVLKVSHDGLRSQPTGINRAMINSAKDGRPFLVMSVFLQAAEHDHLEGSAAQSGTGHASGVAYPACPKVGELIRFLMALARLTVYALRQSKGQE